MRQKTDEKKQQILQVATELFLEHGLGAVSMSQIAAKVGGSKATLYNYFQNKEEIFIAVILDGAQRMSMGITTTIDQSLPLIDKLRILGIKYLEFILSDDNIAFRRNVFSYLPHEKQRKIGSEGFNCIVRSAWGHVADIIENYMKSGQLKETDPWLAAAQLRSLFELDLIERRLLNIDRKISAEEIESNVDRGLAIFLNYYKIVT